MSLRIIGKAYKLASRSRRRFVMFTIVYAVLIAWTAYSVDAARKVNYQVNDPSFIFMLVSIVASIIISMFYANIIVTYRRIEIATFKCIGWTNSQVRILIIGEIFSVTLIAFFFVVEFFLHWSAISAYILTIPEVNLQNGVYVFGTPQPTNKPINIYDIVFVQLIPIIITFGIMLGVQIFGILVANNKILKVRPIQALQMKV